MSLHFNQYAEKGYEFLRLVANEMQVPEEKAGRVLQHVLHTLRDTICVEESLQLMAQLPMMIKAVYVDRWSNAQKKTNIETIDDFVREVRSREGKTAAADLSSDEAARHAIKSIFRVLTLYVSEGELNDIIAVLPNGLKDFVQQSVERRSTL